MFKIFRPPWKGREREAELSRDRARRDLDEVKNRWPVVHELVTETSKQAELNNWTKSIKTIFSGESSG